MRKPELRVVDGDIETLYVDGEYTGLNYTKNDMDLMLDDLVATQERAVPPGKRKSRDQLLAELVTKSLERCYRNNPLDGGPLSAQELDESARIVCVSFGLRAAAAGAGERVVVACPNPACGQRMRLPAGKKGTVTCPSCREPFEAST